MITEDFKRQIDGYGMTTAQILYHLPDYPRFLQTYIWQRYDLAPEFPELNKFLEFWRAELEGPLHSVKIAHKQLIAPGEWRSVTAEISIH